MQGKSEKKLSDRPNLRILLSTTVYTPIEQKIKLISTRNQGDSISRVSRRVGRRCFSGEAEGVPLGGNNSRLQRTPGGNNLYPEKSPLLYI